MITIPTRLSCGTPIVNADGSITPGVITNEGGQWTIRLNQAAGSHDVFIQGTTATVASSAENENRSQISNGMNWLTNLLNSILKFFGI